MVTYHSYNNAWKHTRKHRVSNSKVRNLRESDFQILYRDLLKAGVGNSTIVLLNKVHNVVMKFGCKEDYVRYNFAHEALKGFTLAPSTRKALTIKQQQGFLDFIKQDSQFDHMYNVVHFMLETAIRISEMAALTIHDIDFEHGILTVNKQYLA